MKKIINVIIGILLIGMIALSVILFTKNKELQKQSDDFSAEADSWETMYNSMLQSFTEESAAKIHAETMYESLETKYNNLLAEYEELKSSNENQEIVYEEPGTIEDYDIVTYSTLLDHSADYEGKLVCISGVVTSSATEDGMTLLRISTEDSGDNTLDFIYDSNTIDKDAPVNSYVIVYGLYNGLYNDNVPLILGVEIVVN